MSLIIYGAVGFFIGVMSLNQLIILFSFNMPTTKYLLEKNAIVADIKLIRNKDLITIVISSFIFFAPSLALIMKTTTINLLAYGVGIILSVLVSKKMFGRTYHNLHTYVKSTLKYVNVKTDTLKKIDRELYDIFMKNRESSKESK
jgi:hypothetical protein